jgi:uncharacterized damage-inducible protein DinB
MSDTEVRHHLVWLLEGGHAHTTFDEAVAKFPKDKIGVRPEGAPYSAWQLLEHMRLAQEDILRFSLSADWKSPAWPEGYWPKNPAPAHDSDWDKSIRAFRKDLAEFTALIRDSAHDLYHKFPWGDGQTLMREALLVADHNSYHLGQIVLVRRLLGIWGG